ncbi:MAG TPA: YkgJ family cysteine cluster protein [Planctomycetaceae bacterium]|nr:YkgJ family cysteine cluster protein [Planctomycetaceae bacterium]HIQ21217.1 YkgJ family cysteine cluster protein [Planctomycetota bacterium]
MNPDSPAPRAEPRHPLEERILRDAPRLGPEDTFRFGCRPGISCFNRCCADVSIFLSPYDVLRMKRRLGISSGQFLEQYTIMPVHGAMKTPIVLLRMRDDAGKACPMVTSEGCRVYSDRPWPCRMYPLGLAAQRAAPDGDHDNRFYFLLCEEGCRGFEEQPEEWTVRRWLDDQGIEEYDQWGEAFKELALHPFFEQGGKLNPQQMQMFFMACYDLDKFRQFVFQSTLLDRFEVDEDFVEEMRYSDEALLRFAFLWLRYSLFGEGTMRVKPEVMEAFQGRLDKGQLFGR